MKLIIDRHSPQDINNIVSEPFKAAPTQIIEPAVQLELRLINSFAVVACEKG